MDNQANSSDSGWVDARLAAIAPPENWHPDSHRALAKFKSRRDQPQAAASLRWIQLSMAAAILVAIGLVVTLLPWHALWEGAKEGRNLPTESPKAATPKVEPEPAPVSPSPVTPRPPQPLVASAIAVVQQSEPVSQEQKPPEKVGLGATPPRVIPPIPEPDYSDDARREHIQGSVVLNVIVRADGTGKVESIYRSLGYGLDQKAVEAFEKWKFIPGTKDGNPVDVQLQVFVNFKLN